jgi:hypothetical protein
VCTDLTLVLALATMQHAGIDAISKQRFQQHIAVLLDVHEHDDGTRRVRRPQQFNDSALFLAL